MRWLALLCLSGCGISVHQGTLSDLRPYGAHITQRPVVASAEQFTIMGLDADNTHIDAAWTGLQDQCRRGTLTAIVTETSTRLGFFSWTNKVVFRALCVEPAAASPEAAELAEPVEPAGEAAP